MDATVVSTFFEQARKLSDAAALKYKRDGEWVTITWSGYADLVRVFWETHDPTQGMRQGNDVGTQYRSGIYVHSPEQRRLAEASRDAYQRVLTNARYGAITTEILDAPPFYYAEDYHQQYLAKNPWGYCGIGGTGVACPVGVGAATSS